MYIIKYDFILQNINTVAKAHVKENLFIISATIITLQNDIIKLVSCAYRFFDERNESISLGF